MRAAISELLARWRASTLELPPLDDDLKKINRLARSAEFAALLRTVVTHLGEPNSDRQAPLAARYRQPMNRDLRHVVSFMTVVMPIALIATFLTSTGPTAERHRPPRQLTLTAQAARKSATAEERGSPRDVERVRQAARRPALVQRSGPYDLS
jgi:hypothetical protein